ncbi:MAG: hypothetical protein LBC56_05405 [Oscillospiraceae bacterium]|jgi:hypothetical protein|nr:hypothetical protein [Oscillospiraceae bacterium]
MDEENKNKLPESGEQETQAAPKPGEKKTFKNDKERLYDKIPLTYKQVDIIVKILLALLAGLLIYGIATGTGNQGAV